MATTRCVCRVISQNQFRLFIANLLFVRDSKDKFYVKMDFMLLCLMAVTFAIAASVNHSAECESYPCMVFEDNFDSFDFSKWEHEITMGGGGNWEFQMYHNNRSNSYTKDGKLYIKPTLLADKAGEAFLSSGTLDIWGNHPPNQCTGNAWYGCFRVGSVDNILNPIQSARIRTSHSFTMRYGRVEVEAQMPSGDWLWPAIWLLPRLEEYGTWPASGEIDIVESRGNADLRDPSGKQLGNTHSGATLHWGPYVELNSWDRTAGSRDDDYADKMHKYAVEWDEDGLKFEFDDVEVLNVRPELGGFWELGDFASRTPGIDNPWSQGTKMAPFDKEFYLIMNVAVGGTNGFFGDDWNNTAYDKPWSNTSPNAPKEFWEGRDNWYPTWNPEVNNGEGAAMKVNYVKVWKMKADDGDVGNKTGHSGVSKLLVGIVALLVSVWRL